MPLRVTEEFRRAIRGDPSSCVLLVGAGLSKSGVREGGAGLPDWDALIHDMIEDLRDADKCDTTILVNLRELLAAGKHLRVAGEYKKLKRVDQFGEFLVDRLNPPDLIPSKLHKKILGTGFKGIITTNFDMVFEKQDDRLRTSGLIYPHFLDEVYSIPRDFFFAKIHGCISHNPAKNLILTDEDYLTLRQDEKYQSVMRHFLIGYRILTVGFSLRDPDFSGLIEDFRVIFGDSAPTSYALLPNPGYEARGQWREKGFEVLPYDHHEELVEFFEQISELSEVRPRPTGGPATPREVREAAVRSQEIAREEERQFLESVALPSLKLGSLDLCCKLMPADLWILDRRANLFQDDPEAEQRINLAWFHIPLPEQLLARLVTEIDDKLEAFTKGKITVDAAEARVLAEVHRRLTREGSNAYPRVVAPPEIIPRGEGERTLQIPIGPSRYGIALVEERKLALPTAIELRKRHILNSLAVRVALVFEREGQQWVEFHQRKGGPNATYKESWDVGAAGYIDPRRHQDPEDTTRISPWQACARELSEELSIHSFDLPHRDHYYFFGVGRNDPTGQLDLLAFCDSVVPPDPARPLTARVGAFDRCRLNPESIATFVESKRQWVPTALLVLILTLEAFGFPRERIERAFSTLNGKLRLDP